ncbi:MAG: lipoyl protein ligase domain-containing protein [Acidimicrobiales bacterium]
MNRRPWAIDVAAGPPSALHTSSADLVSTSPPAPRSPGRTIRILQADQRAVVLGSGEPDDHVDRARAEARGVTVVRRRSGGSAVLVGPGQVLWVDVVVPVDDPLWLADVARAGWWLGGCWAGALADVGIPGARVWRGPMVRSAWTPRVCFAGLGPGEVTVGEAGPKVVGISQRRTRMGALFQCAVPLLGLGAGPLGPWDPAGLLDVLRLSELQRGRAITDLAGVAVAVADGRALTDALIERCRSGTAQG